MLVLDRKIGQGFWINDEIFVKVLSINRRRVKFGIDAPANVSILREELYQRERKGKRDLSEAS